MHALQVAPSSERQVVYELIKKYRGEPSILQEILSFIRERGGMAYTHTKLAQHRQKALQLVAAANLPEPSKQILLSLFLQTIPLEGIN
jgi:geranylgeranyl pyrophosphate synthase